MVKSKSKNVKTSGSGVAFEKNGWLYVSVNGAPKKRGYDYGFLVADEMKQIFEMLNFNIMDQYGLEWSYCIELGVKYLKDTIKNNFAEFYEEMEGFAEGCTAAGTKTTLDEILAWNNMFTITENLIGLDMGSSGASREGGSALQRREAGQQERCSAFMAVGDWTADGKIVMAHNNFSEFIDGQYGRVVLDLKPLKGARMLIQGFIGWIWSGTDFFVTSYGIMGTETTIGGFNKFENNWPISCRIRQAMQYGKSLSDYEKILLKENSGDYANSWLFGDINTNEIMRIELGLKYHLTERTKNGFFIGFNAPYDPKIRNLECANTGFDDVRRHQGARKVRLGQLMEWCKGKLDVETAQTMIGDHYDVYTKTFNPCSRTVCSHYELDAREYMSDPARPKPFAARGAIDGNVCDTSMAEAMSFSLRYGNSCGTPFIVSEYIRNNQQYERLAPYLHDRLTQPWTTFSVGESNTNSNTNTNKKSRKHREKKNKTMKNINKE